MEARMLISPRAWRVGTGSLVIILAALVMTGVRPAAQNEGLPMAKPESVGVSSKRLERVRAFIQEYIDTNQIAGAVSLIARKGKVVHFEAQGWRHKEENQPMQKDTIFELMSMTKPIVSTALMMLWEDGKFLLDDPISKWLPSYANKMVMVNGKLVKAEPVTVRHVLTHTSGLSLSPTPTPSIENATATPEQTARTVAAADARARGGAAAGAGGQGRGRGAGGGQQQAQPRVLAEMVERAAPYPLLFQPGTEWRYGDSTDYVAILVEKISGMTLDDFLRKRIFEPLGMRDTFYNVPQDRVNRVSAVYRPDPANNNKIILRSRPEFRPPTTLYRGIAGLKGTTADYWRFCQMLLNGGELDGVRLLGRMTVDMMFSNHIGSGKPVTVRGPGYGFGLGAGVLTDPATARDALSIGTWSWGGANGTIFWIDPMEDLIPIMMIQISPYSHFNIRPLFSVVAQQTVIDSLSAQKPKVMGYDTPH
jgi:CubicO group peptidase (beta-lactamase class C family)